MVALLTFCIHLILHFKHNNFIQISNAGSLKSVFNGYKSVALSITFYIDYRLFVENFHLSLCLCVSWDLYMKIFFGSQQCLHRLYLSEYRPYYFIWHKNIIIILITKSFKSVFRFTDQWHLFEKFKPLSFSNLFLLSNNIY